MATRQELQSERTCLRMKKAVRLVVNSWCGCALFVSSIGHAAPLATNDFGPGAAFYALGQSSGTPQPPLRPQDRTTPFQQKMTAKQISHSHKYDRFKTKTRLLDRRISIKTVVDDNGFALEGSRAPSLSELIGQTTCSADAVFSGVVESAVSSPIDDGTFLFTDYEMRVERVLKMPAAQSGIREGSTVTVTRPGGQLTVERAPVVASHSSFPFLRTGDHYLLFLKYLPDTQSFQSDDPHGTFAASPSRGPGSTVKALRPLATTDADLAGVGVSFERIVKIVTSQTCR